MSQSIAIQGVYRNNKKLTVGTQNPKNNRFFNKDEKIHLEKMLVEHLIPKQEKFKNLYVTMHNDGEKILSSKFAVADLKLYSPKELTNELMELFKFYSK